MRSPPSASVSFPGPQRQGSPRGRVRLASSRGGSSHNDPYGDEERDFGAGFECHLAVVRAIVVELSPGRCDGAPRGGWRRPQETATLRRRAGPLLPALARLQKTRRRRLGVCSLHSLVAAAAPRRLASADTHETGSFQPKRSNLPSYEPCATEELAKRTSSAAADSKAAASNFAPLVLRRSIAMRVLALAICAYVAALQPARNAPRQSLAVRQAPRGVRERRLAGDTREPTPSPRRNTR